MTRTSERSRYRYQPDVVVLPPIDAAKRDSRAPVRIFLGTEDGQWRAERIFFYSVKRVRDPARTYEVHLLKNLHGFDRRGWRTGFTNYRFAVPELAGFEGKAIYNDVDQIYLADPAELFDLELNGHGYLSVSAEDTSVMLLDCARMGSWWTREKSVRGTKATLIREPASEPGLWGKLPDGWNTRDLEYASRDAKVLHFTALHMQPWRPFPEEYSYHHHPLGDLWLDLERQADREHYQVFGPSNPSGQFAAALEGRDTSDPRIPSGPGQAFLRNRGVREVLAVTLGGQPPPDECLPAEDFAVEACRPDRLANEQERHDAIAAVGTLEECPAEDVPWLLDSMFSRASLALWVAVHCCDEPNREADVDVARAIRPRRWWREQMERTARKHPSVPWQLDTLSRDGRAATIRAGSMSGRTPTVWVLEGLRTGDNLQLQRLSEALEWPVERKLLQFNRLHVLPNFLLGASFLNLKPGSKESLAPPWPDLVIAFGKRSASTARRIKEKSGGRTRLVHLGRPWSRLDAFDLIVTTPQYRLPARPNVHHNRLPLSSVTREALEQRREAIGRRFDSLPRPRIAVVVGGDSWSYTFDPEAARRLGESVDRKAREKGGSLLVTTSPRTARRSADALFASIDVPHCAHRFQEDQRDNPYADYLAVADEILVTGDSASMIADAVATGRAVEIVDLPRRLPGRLSAAIYGYLAKLRGTTYRGTPRQQGPLQRFRDALIDHGLFTPTRSLEELHRLLAIQGLVAPGSGRNPGGTDVCGDELDNTVNRVRQLFVEGRPVNPRTDCERTPD